MVLTLSSIARFVFSDAIIVIATSCQGLLCGKACNCHTSCRKLFHYLNPGMFIFPIKYCMYWLKFQFFKIIIYLHFACFLTNWCLCWSSLAMKSNGLCSTSDVTSDQNWHHYSWVLREENIFPMMPRSEWLGHVSEKFRGKLPSTTLGSVVRIAHLHDVYSGTLEQASPVIVLIFITSNNPFNQSRRVTFTKVKVLQNKLPKLKLKW